MSIPTSAGTSSPLPPYLSSALVPSYSPEPAYDERLIEPTSRSRCWAFTDSGYEDPSAELPTYGRQAHITVFVSVEDRAAVTEVTLKGRWKGRSRGAAPPPQASSISSVCSGRPVARRVRATSFSTVLPVEFQDGDGKYALPPSYSVTYGASEGPYVKVLYTLSVTVMRKSGKIRFIPHNNTTSVRLNYIHRTQPTAAFSFLADVKAMPEEWRQASLAPPVDLSVYPPPFFLIFTTIPFHVQRSGFVGALRGFLPAPRREGEGVGEVLKVTFVRR
ncbi:hypothetical protein DFH09DRAFT_1320859 [Mycena vulgaris]|nr:hypothetical protein DFH09DRAFT_1320859 [Mycena vulgaris]